MAFSEKTPPAFNRNSDDYSKWRKKFEVWQSITDVEKKKQGGLLTLRVDDITQDEILESLSTEELKDDEGATKVLVILDGKFQKDKSISAYETYEEFEKYRRPDNVSITEYCAEFERKLAKVKAQGSLLSTEVLAYRLLKSANVTASQEQLIQATIDKIDYDTMSAQLKKVFIGFHPSSQAPGVNIKEEPEDVTYCIRTHYMVQDSYKQNDQARCDRSRNQSSQDHVNQGSSYDSNRNQGSKDKGANRNLYSDYREQKESSDSDMCQQDYQEYELDLWQLLLQPTGYSQEDVHKVDIDAAFSDYTVGSSQTLNSMVFPSVSKSVCGMEWLLQYLETLTPNQKSNVVHTPGNCLFKFSHLCGLSSSVQQVILPEIMIDSFSYSVQVEVVTENIPLLLAEADVFKLKESRKTPCNVNTSIDHNLHNYSQDSAAMFMGTDKEEEVGITENQWCMLNSNDKVGCKNIELKETICSEKPGKPPYLQRMKCKKEKKHSWKKRKKKSVIDMKQRHQLLELKQKQEKQPQEKKTKERMRCRKIEKQSWRKRRKKTVICNMKQDKCGTKWTSKLKGRRSCKAVGSNTTF